MQYKEEKEDEEGEEIWRLSENECVLEALCFKNR